MKKVFVLFRKAPSLFACFTNWYTLLELHHLDTGPVHGTDNVESSVAPSSRVWLFSLQRSPANVYILLLFPLGLVISLHRRSQERSAFYFLTFFIKYIPGIILPPVSKCTGKNYEHLLRVMASAAVEWCLCLKHGVNFASFPYSAYLWPWSVAPEVNQTSCLGKSLVAGVCSNSQDAGWDAAVRISGAFGFKCHLCFRLQLPAKAAGGGSGTWVHHLHGRPGLSPSCCRHLGSKQASDGRLPFSVSQTKLN